MRRIRSPTPEQLLASFRLTNFRLGQRDAIAAALARRDCLLVMPTGGGKSLCYQLPALANRGLVVVVSPLIALMTDQWRKLAATPIRATMLASTMPPAHNRQALAQIRSGAANLVLATPERFRSPLFRAALAKRRIALFAVNEAHCVAEWGHDFRPAYLRLGEAIDELGRPPIMAATATATPAVAREIAKALGLRAVIQVYSGFDRPNLTFDVAQIDSAGVVRLKQAALLDALRSPYARPAIVYCAKRNDTHYVAAMLRRADISAVHYHAGMDPEDRHKAHASFMDKATDVVVATNAFGMGVNKSDVRTVIHWAVPSSLEAYYQEAGRAGRDGRPARALLLASTNDLDRLAYFNEQRDRSVDDVQSYIDNLAANDGESVLQRDRLTSGERALLSIAERSGAILLTPAAGGTLHVRLTGHIDTATASRAITTARDRGLQSYATIEQYVNNSTLCRRAQILDHFADSQKRPPTGRCCDICDPRGALRALFDESPLPPALPSRDCARATRKTHSPRIRLGPASHVYEIQQPIASRR